MSYLVVKEINKNLYLYEQWTYRQGGRVKTGNRYLGKYYGGTMGSVGALEINPRSPSSLPQSYPQPEQGNSKSKTPNSASSSLVGSSMDESEHHGENTKKPKKNLSPTSSRKQKHKYPLPAWNQVGLHVVRDQPGEIKTSLETRKQQWEQWLQGLGITNEPALLPRIVLRSGKKLTTTRSLATGSYIITVPRTKHGHHHHTALQREYLKTLARASLDVMAIKRPEMYGYIAQGFDASFRETQSCLWSYMKHAQTQDRLVKLVCLYWFGMIGKARKVLPDPRNMGLVDYSKRKNWKDEVVTILADIQTRGLDRVWKDQKLASKRAVTQVRNAITQHSNRKNPLSTQYWQTRNQLRRALAREQAVQEMNNKLQLIESLFFSNLTLNSRLTTTKC